ncbi:Gfo/Idh/MocA family oxidoreductase [bacterium]|nr:Gfo/Idh/MocA family oxidoreductase [bacterium]
MPKTPSRRSFLKSGAAAGSALIGSAASASAARTPYKRPTPSSTGLIEVGVITCGYYSHIEDIWGRLINPIGEDKDGTYWPRQSGMVMTMVWDPDRKAAETFAQKYNLKVAQNYYDMVDKVDGVILSDYYATGWWPQLSKPYLEAGMPTLINRPFALSLKEAKEMIDRSKKYNAPILVPSSDEYMFETVQARHRLQMLLEGGGQITGVMAFEPCGEYPAHGVHSIYNIYAIMEPDVIAASLYAEKWWEWGLKGGMMNWLVKGKGDAPDYYVAIRMSQEPDTNGWLMISTTKGRIYDPNDHAGEVFTRYRNIFLPTVIEFQKLIETRKMSQTYEHIMGKTTTYLTGFYSNLVKNGALVPCSELPETWRAPEVMPERVPKDVFR